MRHGHAVCGQKQTARWIRKELLMLSFESFYNISSKFLFYFLNLLKSQDFK